MRTISALRLVLHYSGTLIADKLSIGPVSALELREYEHTLEADLKRPRSGLLLVVADAIVFIRNQIVVQIKIKILLRDLVFHNDSVGHFLQNGVSCSLEEVLVLGFVVARIPAMLLALFAGFYYKHSLILHLFMNLMSITLNKFVANKINDFCLIKILDNFEF